VLCQSGTRRDGTLMASWSSARTGPVRRDGYGTVPYPGLPGPSPPHVTPQALSPSSTVHQSRDPPLLGCLTVTYCKGIPIDQDELVWVLETQP